MPLNDIDKLYQPTAKTANPSGLATQFGGGAAKEAAGGGMAKGIGGFLKGGLTGTNPVAGIMISLGASLLGSWLTKEDEELTPEQKAFRQRMAYFTKLGKQRRTMHSIASSMTGKPASYFDRSIGKTNLSDIASDDAKFAKHIALADSEGA